MNLLRIGSVDRLLSGNIIAYQVKNTIECIFDKNEKIKGIKYGIKIIFIKKYRKYKFTNT